MAGEASAYTALGLEPGADSAAIERAYKRLIKRYHPDREGGDAKRAAEINRAYRELRTPAAKDPLILHDHDRLRAGPNWWVQAALLVAGAAAVMLILTGPVNDYVERVLDGARPHLPAAHVAAATTSLDPMDEPLATATIASAVDDAVHLSRTKDEMALASTSRDCHHELRLNPSLKVLDRCAAFDDAVVQLQDRDPLRDRGPFSEIEVTGRQWSGAAALSDDYLAIDSRLDRIRTRVEIDLAPIP
jgi:hypothetical protein